MNRKTMRGGVCALMAAAAASTAMGQSVSQAPASAQVWDIAFLVETFGASGTAVRQTFPREGAVLVDATPTSSVLTRMGAGNATIAVPASPERWVDEVRVTMLARVAIRTPDAALGQSWNTRNFGVSRVGGPQGNFFISVTDPYTKNTGVSTISRAVVPGGTRSNGTETSVDVNGNPLAGTHWPFRQGFSPSGTGGSNTDPQNGVITNQTLADGSNRSTITNLVQTRTVGWDGVAQGAATFLGIDPVSQLPILEGDYAEVYTFSYKPKLAQYDDYAAAVRNITRNPATYPNINDQIIDQVWGVNGQETNRSVSMVVDGLSVRYLFNTVTNPTEPGVPTGTAQNSTNVNIGTIRFDFVVPTPGGAAVLGLAGLAALRRRR